LVWFVLLFGSVFYASVASAASCLVFIVATFM
jgi:hypothetical protein